MNRHQLKTKLFACIQDYFLFLFLLLFFLGPHLWHMKVSRLGVKLEMQLLAYATATAMPYPSCICNLHHSSWQCLILNPLNESGDQTHILMDTSWVLNSLSHNGNSQIIFLRYIPKSRITGVKGEQLHFYAFNVILKWPSKTTIIFCTPANTLRKYTFS